MDKNDPPFPQIHPPHKDYFGESREMGRWVDSEAFGHVVKALLEMLDSRDDGKFNNEMER